MSAAIILVVCGMLKKNTVSFLMHINFSQHTTPPPHHHHTHHQHTTSPPPAHHTTHTTSTPPAHHQHTTPPAHHTTTTPPAHHTTSTTKRRNLNSNVIDSHIFNKCRHCACSIIVVKEQSMFTDTQDMLWKPQSLNWAKSMKYRHQLCIH